MKAACYGLRQCAKSKDLLAALIKKCGAADSELLKGMVASVDIAETPRQLKKAISIASSCSGDWGTITEVQAVAITIAIIQLVIIVVVIMVIIIIVITIVLTIIVITTITIIIIIILI